MNFAYFFGCILAAASMAVWPRNRSSTRWRGGGHGFGGPGGGHAFVGGGHQFGGFTDRGFSPGFRGTRAFSSGSFSGRRDHGGFGDVVSVDAVATFTILLGLFRSRLLWVRISGLLPVRLALLQLRWVSKHRQFWRLPPSRSSDVTSAVQSALTKRGYYRVSIDGIIGPDSRRAIRAFQASQGLPRNRFNRPRID
jgi:hypothetical protein